MRDNAIARYLSSVLSSAEGACRCPAPQPPRARQSLTPRPPPSSADPLKIAGPVVEALLRLNETSVAAAENARPAAPPISSSSRSSSAPIQYAAAPLVLRSAPLSLARVLAELNENFAPPPDADGDASDEWPRDAVNGVLDALCAHPLGVLSREIAGVRVSPRAAVGALQLRTVETWVSERFSSPLAARILRRVLDHGLLEEKVRRARARARARVSPMQPRAHAPRAPPRDPLPQAISDLVLAEAKAVRALLFRFVAEGLLLIQEVPRRPDRNPQHTSYLFSAHFDRILCVMSDNVCHAILNLRLRHRLESKRYAVALRESDAIMTAAEADEADAVDDAAAERRATVASDIAQSKALLQNIDRGVARMMATILRADETLAIVSEQ
jgi:hypothetical protein